MKVLWLCNIMLPAFARHEGIEYTNREGWLSGSFDKIRARRKDGKCDIDLAVCFPVPEHDKWDKKEIDGIVFYSFHENLNTPEIYKPELETRFKEIIEDYNPDVVHIFGTEFPHSLAMIKAYDKPSQTLLGIQGLCCAIADEYMAELPEHVRKDATIRDKLKHDSLLEQQAKFRLRAENEREMIKRVGHITGRTSFDRNAVLTINPDAKYHAMNETMRENFYEGEWREQEAVPHSIFLSQGDYPLKGFHFVLEALPKLMEKYPDTHVYVAGNSIIGAIDRKTVTIPNENGAQIRGSRYPLFMRISAYGKYLRFLIAKGRLKNNVTILGKLSAAQMKEQYLKASVFVCPSIVENSPNSVGEAMLLGVPIVAARTGGIPSMLDDGRDGILFEPGDVAGLTEAILQIWEERVITGVYSENARKHALMTHDADINYARLLEIYHALER